MRIWVTRHGQTRLNKKKLMQGRIDEPLNETGLRQAQAMRELLISTYGDVKFDAVYSSPLVRAVVTGAVIGGVPEDQVITDPRLIETDFGRYERCPYWMMGPKMTFYWALPEIFPAPSSVETISSMTARSRSFFAELEAKDCRNVLIACHGGILRALCGYLEDRPNGITWRPRARNCEVRIYDSVDGKHSFVGKLTLP